MIVIFTILPPDYIISAFVVPMSYPKQKKPTPKSRLSLCMGGETRTLTPFGTRS